MAKNECKVITGIVRFSYLNVLEPRAMEGQDPRYSVSLVIPKTDTVTINNILNAVNAAYEVGEQKLRTGKTVPPLATLKTPLRDGDKERPDDEVYKGCYFLNASAPADGDRVPQVVDVHGVHLTDSDHVYSGMYGRASINFYAFCKAGNKGIACGLNNLLKTADGERLGGASSAEEDFSEFYEAAPAAVSEFGEILSDGGTPF